MHEHFAEEMSNICDARFRRDYSREEGYRKNAYQFSLETNLKGAAR